MFDIIDIPAALIVLFQHEFHSTTYNFSLITFVPNTNRPISEDYHHHHSDYIGTGNTSLVMRRTARLECLIIIFQTQRFSLLLD